MKKLLLAASTLLLSLFVTAQNKVYVCGPVGVEFKTSAVDSVIFHKPETDVINVKPFFDSISALVKDSTILEQEKSVIVSVKDSLNSINETLKAKVDSLQEIISFDNGAIRQGYFLVSASKKVKFSRGNLQFQPSTATWRFAKHQYDIIGNDVGNNVSINRATQEAWIDLFGWGDLTGIKTSEEDSDYSWTEDWGTKIDDKGTWQTLSDTEWDYLQKKHVNGWSIVAGVAGKVFLPKNWALENTIASSYTASEWTKMESYGALFLPAAGQRQASNVHNAGEYGNYWSNFEESEYKPKYILITSEGNSITEDYRNFGNSVRLVTVVE